ARPACAGAVAIASGAAGHTYVIDPSDPQCAVGEGATVAAEAAGIARVAAISALHGEIPHDFASGDVHQVQRAAIAAVARGATIDAVAGQHVDVSENGRDPEVNVVGIATT